MSGIGYVWVGLGADDDWADAANWSTPGYSGPPAPLYPYDNIPPSSGPWTFYSATISDATVTGSGGADQLVTTDVVFDGTFSFGYAGAWGFASSLSGTLEVSGGSVTQSSDEALSTGATLQVDAGATYAIAWGTLSGGAFINNGTVIGESTIQSYINSSDSVVSEGQIFTPFTNNGTLTIDAGDQFLLASDSSNSAAGSILDGTIDGAGTLTIAVNVTLDPTSLTVGAIDNLDIITLGGDLTYGGALTSDDTINLDDYSLTLTGSGSNFAPSYLGAGTVYGGTLLVKGSAEITDLNFGSPASASDPLPSLFEDAGSITETVGGIGLGVSSELLINSGASYTLTATASLYATNTGASIINNGTLTDADATDGTSTIAGSFTNNGTLHVDAGDTLELTSGGDTLDGAITGAGTLELYKTSASLDPTALGVAAITLTNADITLQGNRTYAGVLTTSSENGGTTYINLGGYKLTLSGSNNVFGYQTILDGPGDLKVTGAALLPASYLGFTINPGAEIEDAGQITDGESFIVSGGELLVDSGGTFELDEAVALYSGGSQYALGAIVNNGKFVDASEGGTATVEGSFANNGTLTINSGNSLSLVGGSATLGGAITGAGTLLINEATTLETTSLTVATLTLFNASTTTLGADVSYGGAFNFDTQQAGASLALAGHTLTLSGGGTFYGANNWGGGEILITGSATFLSGADSGLGFGSSTGSLVVAGQADFNGSGHLYGSITVDAGASVTIAGQIWGANAGADIDFDGANATLTLGDLSSGYVSAFSIAGLGIGDTIALDDVTANGAYINGSNQLVVTDDGTTEVTLQLSGSNNNLGFATIATSSGTELIALPDPATVADYESYVSDYDQITGGFAVSDSASAIVAALKTLDADPNISSLDFSSGSASLKSGASLSAPAVSVKGTGTALTIAEALNYAGNLTLGAGARRHDRQRRVPDAVGREYGLGRDRRRGRARADGRRYDLQERRDADGFLLEPLGRGDDDARRSAGLFGRVLGGRDVGNLADQRRADLEGRDDARRRHGDGRKRARSDAGWRVICFGARDFGQGDRRQSCDGDAKRRFDHDRRRRRDRQGRVPERRDRYSGHCRWQRRRRRRRPRLADRQRRPPRENRRRRQHNRDGGDQRRPDSRVRGNARFRSRRQGDGDGHGVGRRDARVRRRRRRRADDRFYGRGQRALPRRLERFCGDALWLRCERGRIKRRDRTARRLDREEFFREWDGHLGDAYDGERNHASGAQIRRRLFANELQYLSIRRRDDDRLSFVPAGRLLMPRGRY